MVERMEIRRADAMGMCFGVRDALQAMDGISAPSEVTVHGELVHNGEVLRLLDRRGFRQSDEQARAVPSTPSVLITAHGVSERERERLRAAGKRLIDTTCPLVQKAHDAAQQLQREGRRVVVLGRAGHVEVRGIVEDLDDALVVGSERDVRQWPQARLGVVCQTTTATERVASLLAEIRRRNPGADVRFRHRLQPDQGARRGARGPAAGRRRARRRRWARLQQHPPAGRAGRGAGRAGAARRERGRAGRGLVGGAPRGRADRWDLDAGRDDRRGARAAALGRGAARRRAALGLIAATRGVGSQRRAFAVNKS
jgi:hypothetical protein